MNTSNPDSQIPFIRKATIYDADEIKAMVTASYSKYIGRIGRPPAPTFVDYHDLIQQSSNDIYVLTDNHELLGALCLIEEPASNSIQISNVAVNPGAQGKGFGRLLVAFSEAQCVKRGFAAVTLYTNVKMHENVALYLKLGYTETQRQKDGPYERVYFRKDLHDTTTETA